MTAAVTTYDMWLAVIGERDQLQRRFALSTKQREDAELIARNALATGSQMRVEIEKLKIEVANLRCLLVAAGYVLGDVVPSDSGHIVVSQSAIDALSLAVEAVLGAKVVTL